MRMKPWFRPITSVNKLYRNPIPRTLQIATRRNMSQTLKFVSNQTYQVVPGGSVGGMQNTYLRIRANSIFDVLHENGANQPNGTFISQDPANYGPSVSPVNAEGWNDWVNRYYHFTVLGSRIQATYVPTGPNPNFPTAKIVPSTFYINLSGSNTQLNVGSEMSTINKLPYTKRAGIVAQQSNAATGAGTGISSRNGLSGTRLFMNYSTKKFEGVHDVADNKQLRGDFDGNYPTEGSYYTVGIRNTIPSSAGASAETIPPGLLRIKVEYIVKLTEPTNSNQVQEPGSIFG